MKTRLVRWIAIVSAAILAASPLSASAAPKSIDELDFANGKGSVSVVVRGVEKESGGEEKFIPLEGVKYAIYQLWSLDASGKVVVNPAFANVADKDGNKISQEWPHDTLKDYNSNTYQDEESFRKANEAFMKRVDVFSAAAEKAEPYRSNVDYKGDGVYEAKDLPYGGYLFVVKNEFKQVYSEGNEEGWRVADFMISVPVLNEDGKWEDVINATPKTYQPVKEEVQPSWEFAISKINQNGEYVSGASLKVVPSPDKVTGQKGDDAATNLAINLGEPAQWISGNGPYMAVLDEGYYTLYELEEDGLPTGYKVADPLNFYVDAKQGLTYFDENWNEKTTDKHGNPIQYDTSTGLAYVQTDVHNYFTDGAKGRDATMVDPVDIEIEKKVNQKYHEDLKAKEEVVEYEITTTIAPIAKKSFKIKDVLEPVLEFVMEDDDRPYIGIYIGDDTTNLRDDLESSITYETTGERQKLEINITGDDLEEYRGQNILVTFLAKIKADADLSPYANEYVPNDCSYQIDNSPEVRSNTVTIVPPKKIVNLPVKKIWNDNDNAAKARPESVTIILCARGKKTEQSLVLNESNNWSGEFKNLPKEDEDGVIEYTIVEMDVEKYEATIKASSEGGFTVTNTYVPNKPPTTGSVQPKQPKTGDTTNAGLYGVLFAGAAAAIFFLILGKRRKKQ